MISLNKDSAIPIYRQLADVLHCQILKGELKQGDRLPLEFALVEIGARAARLSIDWLRGAGLGAPLERVWLPTHLVIRQSCGEVLKSGNRVFLQGEKEGEKRKEASEK